MDSRLTNRVEVSVGGAPESLCEEALRGAFEEICKRVPLWTSPVELTVPEEHVQKAGATLDGPDRPAGTGLLAMRNVRVNGLHGRGVHGSVLDGKLHDLFGVLQAGDKVEWEEVYAPVTHDAIIPERLSSMAGTAAACLACAELLAMPHKRWSDPNAAAEKRREYLGHLTTLIRMGLTPGGGEIAMIPEEYADE